MENFYQVLGVKETSSQDEIKKAYRKLAIEHHPDKGGSEETFKKISEAYDTLGDEVKKRQYDNQKNNPFGNMGAGFDPFGDMFGMFNQQGFRRGAPDKVLHVNITVLESFNASDKEITYSREMKCDTCSGNGGDKSRCHICEGQGFIAVKVGGSMFSQVIRQTCNNCNGSGQVYKTVCHSCNGKTTKPKMEKINIKLPHGIDESQFLKMHGYGDYSNGVYGNLVLKTTVLPIDNWEKLGDDLIFNKYYGIDELHLESLEIPHPSGNISINLPKEFNTSVPLRVKGKGFNNGDLFVKQHVKFTRP